MYNQIKVTARCSSPSKTTVLLQSELSVEVVIFTHVRNSMSQGLPSVSLSFFFFFLFFFWGGGVTFCACKFMHSYIF